MLKEKGFKCKRYIYLTLVHLKILIKDNFLVVLIMLLYLSLTISLLLMEDTVLIQRG